MKRIVLPLSLLILLLWGIAQPPDVLSLSATFLAMRKAYTLLTGTLLLGWMGLCMLMALRPAWLENYLGGLDRLYHTHKWTGIGTLVMVAAHWLLVLSPRTLIEWGWIEPVSRLHRAGGGHGSLFGIGKEFGEWAAWGLIALGLVSLLRFVPYAWFKKLHKVFPVVFAMGAFHSIVMLVREDKLLTPLGILTAIICIVGTAIAVYSLLGLIGSRRRFPGRVANSTASEAGVLDLRIDVGPEWPGHREGQFALLTLDRSEGAHPFTIVSAGGPGVPLRFAIKPLGDYTRTLAGRIKAGDAVTVEGPYGCFDFGALSEDQVWVAGGVGVAPFISRLEKLAANSEGEARGRIHFFYSVRTERDAMFPEGLQDLCSRAGVALHLHVDDRQGLLSAEEIGRRVRGAASVWFCGPAKWAESLHVILRQGYGLPPGKFHRELFEFR